MQLVALCQAPNRCTYLRHREEFQWAFPGRALLQLIYAGVLLERLVAEESCHRWQ
jgi:hypothetical protein